MKTIFGPEVFDKYGMLNISWVELFNRGIRIFKESETQEDFNKVYDELDKLIFLMIPETSYKGGWTHVVARDIGKPVGKQEFKEESFVKQLEAVTKEIMTVKGFTTPAIPQTDTEIDFFEGEEDNNEEDL